MCRTVHARLFWRLTVPRRTDLTSVLDKTARLSAPRKGNPFSFPVLYFTEHSTGQPSIQKLVSNCASECLAHLSDEAVHSEAYREDIPGVLAALDDLEGDFGDSLIDRTLLEEALGKMEARFIGETRKHERNVRYPLV